ncbi:MAG: hypothetical protein O3A47_09575 [Chloroflexi bacterium]|nr:hypothetical protein [Chloroflexota bacterium]
MSRSTQRTVGILAVVVVGLVLWPIFSRGEPVLIVLLTGFLGAGALLVRKSFSGNVRWARYALLGVIPGFLIGGVGLGLVAWFAGVGSSGWEDLAAIAAGILGAFAGAVAGAVIGGLYGRRKDRQSHRKPQVIPP